MKTLKDYIKTPKDTLTIKLGKGYEVDILRVDFSEGMQKDFGCPVFEYRYELYYKGEEITDITDRLGKEHRPTSNDTKQEIKQKFINYLNNKWLCYEDYQGTDFLVGCAWSLKEWKEWAIWDRDLCDDDYGYRLMKRTPQKEITSLIEEYWELGIRKVVLQ